MVSEISSEAGFNRGCACAYDPDISFCDSSDKDVEAEPRFVEIGTLDFGKVDCANDTSNDDSAEEILVRVVVSGFGEAFGSGLDLQSS